MYVWLATGVELFIRCGPVQYFSCLSVIAVQQSELLGGGCEDCSLPGLGWAGLCVTRRDSDMLKPVLVGL